jgi:1-deoxyxylulose-5-phosphate synthase
MKKIDRRTFIRSSAAGLAGLTLLGTGFSLSGAIPTTSVTIDRVKLGKTGLTVPRVAFGTGTNGFNHSSNFTRMGKESFIKIARYAWDRGIHFFDTADSYGSQPFVREVLKELPREKATLLSKIWTSDTEWQKAGNVAETLDRLRKETGSEYFDIVLLHCMTNGNWKEEKKGFMEGLSKARQQGIVKAVGVSCHNWDAMKVAVEEPWVDVILARINPFGVHMDGTPEAVSALLKTAADNGKGVIGMKIFGNGDKVTEQDREQSIRYAMTNHDIHAVTLGMQTVEQIDDAVERVMRNAGNK